MISVQRLSPKLIVSCRAARKTFTPEIEAIIDLEWAKAQRENPTLFNGEVLTLDQIETDSEMIVTHLLGRFIDYRSLVASRAHPEIFAGQLPVPLGVSAATFCRDGLICGKRGKSSAFESGRWELAPGGTIDRAAVLHDQIDLTALILREMEEELGIGLHAVESQPTPYAFVLKDDLRAPQAEIGLKMIVDMDRAGVMAAFAGNEHREHSEIAVLAQNEIERFETMLTPIVEESAALARALKA